MAISFYNGYGVINVKVEIVEQGTQNVIYTVADSTVIFLPIVTNGLPYDNTLIYRIGDQRQPYSYFGQFFPDYNFIGSRYVLYNAETSTNQEASNALSYLRKYAPNTSAIVSVPIGDTKITDIISGNYIIIPLSSGVAYLYTKNGTDIGISNNGDGAFPFQPRNYSNYGQNFYTSNLCIGGYDVDDDGIIHVSSVEYVGLRCYIGPDQKDSIYTCSGIHSSSMVRWLNDVGSYDPTNPYDPGGESDTGGGNPGDFNGDSDKVPVPPLPTLSAANTGFTRIYNPSLSQVQALARYLWTDETVIDTIWNHIKQFFENPMEAIIGFNLVPVPVPNGGTQNFALMYIDTGVAMTVAAAQFVDQDCGTAVVNRYYGSALDQSPNTRVSCFLPFIGIVRLNTDEVMGKTLQIKYRVDIVSGSCVAMIIVDGSVLYQYSGHCAINIPISSADFSSYVSAAISVAKLAIGAAVGGGIGALTAGSSINPNQQTNNVTTISTNETETARNPVTGRQITLGTKSTIQTIESPKNSSSTKASFDGLSPANISNTVGQVMSSKPIIEHSGSFSGNSGYLGVRRPYLIIERPNMCLPANYGNYNGYPCMITLKLGSLSGYTQVQQIQLKDMSATNPEQAEILTLLKSGVIF